MCNICVFNVGCVQCISRVPVPVVLTHTTAFSLPPSSPFSSLLPHAHSPKTVCGTMRALWSWSRHGCGSRSTPSLGLWSDWSKLGRTELSQVQRGQRSGRTPTSSSGWDTHPHTHAHTHTLDSVYVHNMIGHS